MYNDDVGPDDHAPLIQRHGGPYCRDSLDRSRNRTSARLPVRGHGRRQRLVDAERRRDVGADPATKFAGFPAGDVYVSRIEPSHFDTTTFYITFDNHRWNDFTPYALRDDRRGQDVPLDRERPASARATRTSCTSFARIRTTATCCTSVRRGRRTCRSIAARAGSGSMPALPTVPVYDLKIHPRDRELIAATHGRGFWIVDVAPLEQLAGDSGKKVVADNAYPLRSRRRPSSTGRVRR